MQTRCHTNNYWSTYDNKDGEPSNVVICPECYSKFVDSPSLRPLENQIPDPTISCDSCGKQWI